MSDWETPRTVDPTGLTLKKSLLPEGRTSGEGVVNKVLQEGRTLKTEGRALKTEGRTARVTPIPQIDAGPLSPLSSQTTPRIPAQDLRINVSQRLFETDFLWSDAGGSHVSPGGRLVSPGNRLATHSYGSPEVEAGNNRVLSYVPHRSPLVNIPSSQLSHQDNTERRFLELQRQVEQLKNMYERNNKSDDAKENLSAFFEDQATALIAERDHALSVVQDRDKKLSSLQAAIAQMNAEYAKDIAEVKEQVESLTEDVMDREEKFKSLETEHKKSLKTIQGLQSYLMTLPAAEEVRDLKSKLRAKEEEFKEAETRAEGMEKQLRKAEGRSKENMDKLKEVEVEKEEVKMRLDQALNKLKGYETRRYEATNLDDDQVEHLLFDKEELGREVEKLKKVLEWKQSKFNEEINKKEDQIRQIGSLLEQANIQLREGRSQVRELSNANRLLEADLKEANETGELVKVVRKNAVLEMEVNNLKASDENAKRLDGYYTRLFRSLGLCMKELDGLNDVVRQIMGGSDPNMSLLLGVREVTLSPESLLLKPLEDLSLQQRIDLARGQMEELKRLNKDIAEIRKELADKYAESLVDNMTSCVTQ